jgi:hypothetical protein
VGEAAVQETPQQCGATSGATCTSGGYTFNITRNTNEFLYNAGTSGALQSPSDVQRPAGPSAAIGVLFTSSSGPISPVRSAPQDSPVYGGPGYSTDQFPVVSRGANDLMVLSVHTKNPGDSVASVSGGGVASWTRAAQFQAASGDTTDNELWYGVVSQAGTTPITFSWNQDPATITGDSVEFVAQEFTAPTVAIPPYPISTVAVQGPNHSTYVYWELSNAQWYGPLGVGAYGTSFSAPSVAISPTSGLPTVAVEGPNNSTYVYWEAANAQWYGPLGLGNYGQSFSAPTVAIGPTGLPTVAVQGPNHSTYVYWEAANAQWYGPLGVGPFGSSFSAPSIADSPTNGLPTVAVQGPNSSTYVYWEAANAQWYGPLGIGSYGSSFSAPSIADSQTSGLPTVGVEGPGNSTYVYWEAANAQWYGPLGAGPFGSSFSAPSVADGPNGLPTVAVQGPNSSTYVYWEAANAQWYGPLGIGSYGSSFSAPSLAFVSG